MARSWTEYDERSQADRDRDRAAREIARRTKVSRKANRHSPWSFALAGLCVVMAVLVMVVGACGELSVPVGMLFILAAAALLA